MNIEWILAIAAGVFLACLITVTWFAYKIIQEQSKSFRQSLEQLFLMRESKNTSEYTHQRAQLEKLEPKPEIKQVQSNGKSDVANPSLEEKMAQEVMALVEVGMSVEDAARQIQKKYKSQLQPIGPIGGDDIEEEMF